MAATFKVEIFKTLGAERWGNVYLLDAGSMEAAIAAGALIYAMEEELHLPVVTLEYMRVSTTVESDGVFTTVPLNTVGTSGQPGQAVPLFVTARLDMPVVGGGRPSRKFYRGVLTEAVVEVNSLVTGDLAYIAGNFNTLISDLAGLGSPLVDPQGQELDSAVLYPKPQMRQLHRKRRRVTPS